LPPPPKPISGRPTQAGIALGELPEQETATASAAQFMATGQPDPAWGGAILAAQPGEWTATQEAALAELVGGSILRRDGPASAEIPALIRGESNISSAEQAASRQAAQAIAPVSSAGLNQPPPHPGAFWLNVNAELVLYGATEADAQVIVAGQPVQLRPDGTFSCRFALPDGFYQLAIQASSARGDVRQAELDFSRATRYGADTGVQPGDQGLKPPVAP